MKRFQKSFLLLLLLFSIVNSVYSQCPSGNFCIVSNVNINVGYQIGQTYTFSAVGCTDNIIVWQVPTGISVNGVNGGNPGNVRQFQGTILPTIPSSVVLGADTGGNPPAGNTSNFCFQSYTFITITASSAPVAPIISSNNSPACPGEESILSVTNPQSGYTYIWHTQPQQIGTSITVSPNATTTYTITARSPTGAEITVTYTLTVQNNISVSITPELPTITCGQSTTLRVIGTFDRLEWIGLGLTTSSITVSPTVTTTYTVRVTRGNCTKTFSRTVTVLPLPSPTITANPLTICAGGSSTLSVVSPQAGVTYTWSNGGTGTSTVVTPSATQMYYVTATNAAGCTSSNGVKVFVNAGMNPISITPSNPTICQGDFVTLSVVNPQAGVTYTWNSGQTGNSITVNPSSSFTYRVTGRNGICTDLPTASSRVTVLPAIPIPSIGNAQYICEGTSTTITISNPQQGVIYTWSTGQTGTSITVNPSVTTSYTVSAGSGPCAVQATKTIHINPTPSTPIITFSRNSICQGESVTLSVHNPVGGTIYTWSTGQTGNSIVVSPSSTTTYSVTANNGGCISSPRSQTIVVTSLSTPIIGSNRLTICPGESTTLFVSNPQSGVLYTWSDGQTGRSITVNPSITTPYTVRASKSSCTRTSTPQSVQVTTSNPSLQPPQIVRSGSGSGSGGNSCPIGGRFTIVSNVNTNIGYQIGQTYTFSAVGCTDNTIVWQVPMGISVNGIDGYDPGLTVRQFQGTILPTIASHVEIGADTDGNPAGSNSDFCFQSYTCLAITVINDDCICPGDEVFLEVVNPVNGVDYEWSTGQTGTQISINPTGTTTYSVTANNGCSSLSTEIEIAVCPAPIFSINSSSPSICMEGSSVLSIDNPEVGVTYSWNTIPVQTGTSITVSPSATTTYTATATNAAGCTAQSSTTVTINGTAPQVNISASATSVNCGSSVTLTASGATTYSWTRTVNGITTPIATTNAIITVSPSATTTYTVTGTTNGCSATASQVISTSSSMEPPVVNVTQAIICDGESTVLSVASPQVGVTYTWSTVPQQTGTSIIVSPSTTRTYSVTATTNGCSATTEQIITVAPTPIISATQNSICSGGSSTLNVTNPQTGFTYTWRKATATTTILHTGTSFTVSPLVATTYIVVASNGTCSMQASKSVTLFATVLTPTITSTTTNVCSGQSVTLSVSNPETGVSYSWNTTPVQTGSTITVNPGSTTIYTVTATNTDNCSAEASREITVSSSISTPIITANPTTICSGQAVTLSVSNPQTGVTYTWDNGQTGLTRIVNPNFTTTYRVTANNSSNCAIQGSVVVNVASINSPTISATQLNVCNSTSTTLSVPPQSGVTYTWSTGQTGNSITVSPNTTTTYSVTAQNSLGCSRQVSQVITTNCGGALPCSGDIVEIGVPNNTTESVQAKTLTQSAKNVINALNENLKKQQGTGLFKDGYYGGYGPSYTKYSNHEKMSTAGDCPPNQKVPFGIVYYTNKEFFRMVWVNSNNPSIFRDVHFLPTDDVANYELHSTCFAPNHLYRIYPHANLHTTEYIDYSNSIIDQDEPNYNDPWLSMYNVNILYNDIYGLPFRYVNYDGTSTIGTMSGQTYSEWVYRQRRLYYNHLVWKEQITVRRVSICEGESVVLTAPAGGINYLWSNGATTQQISATQEGMYSFSYEEGGCTINSDVVYIKYDDCPTPPCETTATTTLTFPAYQLNEVINTSAQTLSDNWLLSKYTPFKIYDGTLDLPEANSRPYVVGKQGIWRGESSFAYVTDRKQTTSNVDLKTDGTYTLNMFNWKYLGELDCPEWRKVETVSEYHPQSSDVERYNILKLYSSFHIGYSDQLVSAAAANSKQYEFGFEGFEEYTSQIDKANANLLFATQTTVSDLKIPYWFTLETGRNRRIWSSLELQTLQNQYSSSFTKLHVLGKQIDVNYPGEFRSHTTFEAITIDTDKSLITFSQNEAAPFEGFWTGKVGVTIDKIATQTFTGTAPQLVDNIAHTGKKSLKINASASFEQPYLLLIPNKKYVVSAWVRVDQENKPLRMASYQDYANLKVKLGNGTDLEFKPQGQIIEGWQRIEGSFTVPNDGMGEWSIELASSQGLTTYFDDIRLFPSLGNMESFVYDTETFRLEAKLDANNYATFYYYDAEGRLYLVKQETAKGVQTLQTVTTHTKRN